MALQGSRLVPARYCAVGLEDAQVLQAIALLTAIHKQPDTEERAGFSFAMPTANVPSVTPEPASGSARPCPSPALREQPQL